MNDIIKGRWRTKELRIDSKTIIPCIGGKWRVTILHLISYEDWEVLLKLQEVPRCKDEVYNIAQWSLAAYTPWSMTPPQCAIRRDQVKFAISCGTGQPVKLACILRVISVKYYNVLWNKIKSFYSPLFIFFYIPLNLFCFTNSCESRRTYEKHELLKPDRISLFQKTAENIYQILVWRNCCSFLFFFSA